MHRCLTTTTKAALVVASLVWSVLVVATGAAAAAPAARTAEPASVPVEVTLVTGDHVLISSPAGGPPVVTVLPATRSGQVPSYTARHDGDDVYVIPTDVARLVPRVLDPALFDVTALVRMGYDDASRPGMPLIVQNAPGARRLGAGPMGLQVGRGLASIGGEAADLPKSRTAEFGAALTRLGAARSALSPAATGAALGGISRVWLDSTLTATDLDHNLTQIGAPAAWQSGLSGTGVKVAVLDTGIDADHADLTGQVADSANFTTDAVGTDDNGHGTHVASLVAGTGAAAGGARRGVAYGAHLLVGKVLDGAGKGQLSWVIAGMQWAVDHGADIVNMSLGGAPTTAGGDPVVDALDSLSASSKALFVVAAGNTGSGRSTVQSPGDAPAALTVGAVAADDSTASFSSRGPTPGDFRIKPDIGAPGVAIIGAKAGARTGNLYTTYSGTSQATPQVAGAAALLLQEHPTWTGEQVKTTLVDTADPVTDTSPYDDGGGRLDLARATSEGLSSSVPEVDFGLDRWPDRSQHTQQVTLSNPGGSAVTVQLAAAVAPVRSGPSTGVSSPDPVTLSADHLTIAAGGSASFGVTFDPGAATAGTLYGGTVSVTTGGVAALNLPVGFEVEPERYDVTVSVVDRHGNPYAGGSVDLVNGDNGNTGSFEGLTLNDQGTATARLAPGWYGVISRIETPAADGTAESVSFAGAPEVHVTADTSVRIDARDARALQAPTVSGVPTRLDQAQVYYSRLDSGHSGITDLAFPTADDITAGRVFVQPSARPVTHGQFALTTRWRLLPSGRSHDADLYDLVRETPTIPDPPTYRLGPADVRDLARLDVSYHALGTAATVPEIRASWTDITDIAVGAYRPVSLPSHRIELVSAAPNIHYTQNVIAPGPLQTKFFEPDVTYQPGEHRVVNWFSTLHPDVVEAPRYPTSQWMTAGLGDGEHVAVFSIGHGTTASLQLRRNGAVIGTVPNTFGYFTVPDGPAHFAAEQQLDLDPAQIPAPASSHTTWAFGSAPTTDPAHHPTTVPAIVKLDYQPGLDPLGYARAHRALILGLRVTHLAGSAAPSGGFQGVRLWFSTDQGGKWRALHVVRTAVDRYLAVVPGGDLKAGDAISLRGTAQDGGGNSIDQTVQGIFRVH